MLIITRSFTPREGGAERQLRFVATALDAQGYRVTVATESLPGSPRTETHGDGVSIVRVGNSRLRGPLSQGAFTLGALFRGLQWRPSIIVTSQLGAASVVGGLLARTLGRPHILRLTGGGDPRYRSEPIAKASTRRGRLLCSFFDRERTTIIAPAKHLLADFTEAFPRSRAALVHVPNGVAIETVTPTRRREVIWYSRAGSVASREAFLAIAAIAPDITFTAIGKALPPPVPENVTESGWLSTPETVLADHRVLINTSPREGMPNTVLQALAVGCRIVAFENAGMCEIRADHGSSVTLVPGGDSRAAVEALRNALRDAPPPIPHVDTIKEVTGTWIVLIKRALAVRP